MEKDLSAHYAHHGHDLFARPSNFKKEEAHAGTEPFAGPKKKVAFNPKTMVKLITWNVNGIRAVLRKSNDLQKLLKREQPDLLCLQETKLAVSRDCAEIGKLKGYVHVDSVSTKRNGYSGTRVYLRVGSAAAEALRVAYCPVSIGKAKNGSSVFPREGLVESHLGTKGAIETDGVPPKKCKDGRPLPPPYQPQLPHDPEGRMVSVELPGLILVNTYVPNSGVPQVDKLDRRVKDWDPSMRAALKSLRAYADAQAKATKQPPKPVIWTGDLNVADRDVDRHWEGSYGVMTQDAGFTPHERASFRQTLADCRLVDAFRWLYPQAREAYSYWSMFHNGRQGNRGWRIDGFCVSAEHRDRIVQCYAMPPAQFASSDHNPVVLWLHKGPAAAAPKAAVAKAGAKKALRRR